MMESTAVNGIEDAPRHCGVTDTTLAPREKDALDRQGYLVLPGVIGDDRLARLRAAFETGAGQGRRSGIGCDLDWNGPVYDGLSTHPRVQAAVYHALCRP